MLTGKKIGVLMGGDSAEREVSLRSGMAVYNALRRKGYNVTAIDVGRDICGILSREGVEIAFLVLHGGYGEDGSIQGLLEVLGIPYTGSGVLASALSMDKEASKKIFTYHGIPVPPFVVLSEKERVEKIFDHTFCPFEMPWVIKPSKEGSSIGVSIVRTEEEINTALDSAFRLGRKIIIEKYIEGREIQVGILNNRVLGSIEVRPKKAFYSYEAKYTPGLTEYISPPEISDEDLRRIEDFGLKAHIVLGCKGATRVDTILSKEGDVYVLEVNTIPGMTETSLLPKIARQSNLEFDDLIEEILRDAIVQEA
ncbi:MAG: D-alanine--D-alanine ligase [Thermodesulfovibrionales bacterium]